jgi:hypothetical protein
MIQHDWYLFMVVPVAPTKMLVFFLMKEREGERDTNRGERHKNREQHTKRGTILFNIALSNLDAAFL